MTWIILLFAFVCGFIMDLVWTLCVDAVTRRRPVQAANLSALLYVCTIVSTILIVEKYVFAVIAYIGGGWIGTYLVVRYRRDVNMKMTEEQYRNYCNKGKLLLNTRVLKVYKMPGLFWFRLFDRGLLIKDMRRHSLLFSQRQQRHLSLGNWKVFLLWKS